MLDLDRGIEKQKEESRSNRWDVFESEMESHNLHEHRSANGIRRRSVFEVLWILTFHFSVARYRRCYPRSSDNNVILHCGLRPNFLGTILIWFWRETLKFSTKKSIQRGWDCNLSFFWIFPPSHSFLKELFKLQRKFMNTSQSVSQKFYTKVRDCYKETKNGSRLLYITFLLFPCCVYFILKIIN